MEPYWPPPYAADQYRPLTSLFLSVQYIAGAGSPVIARVVSYVLYALVSVLVFTLARRALPGQPAAAALAALLFAAHPVHVEATALAVGQAELLVALFTLVAVNRYVDMRRGSTPTARDWWLLCGCYAAAALSKEQGFLLPAFLLAAEAFLVTGARKESRRALWRGYSGLAAVGITVAVMRIAVLDGSAPQNVAEALQGRGFGARLLTALQLVPEWLRLLSWPEHLRLDYSPQEYTASSGFGAREALGAALVLAIVAVAWRASRRAAVVTFGIVWFALAILPVSNVLVPTGVMLAERTLFLPSVGWMLVIGGAVAAIMPRLRRGRWAQVALAAAFVLAGLVRSAARQREWRDTDTLTRAAIRDSPRSWRANANHADLLFREARHDDARMAYDRAIAFAPSPWWVRHAYARHLYDIEDYESALAELATSLAEFPDQPDAVRDAVATLIALGRYAEARRIAGGLVNSGRETRDIVRLGRLADSALASGAPPRSLRVGLSPGTPQAPGARP